MRIFKSNMYHLDQLPTAAQPYVVRKTDEQFTSASMPKDNLPVPIVKTLLERYWKRAIFLVVMAIYIGFAVYCGVQLGSTGGVGLEVENVTSTDDTISVTSRAEEINPSTPFTTDFTQLENNSTPHSNENVPYVTDKIPTASSPKLSPLQCIPRNKAFCSNHHNYTYTFYPNFAGDKSEHDFNASWAFYQTIIDSQCHPMIEKFICLAVQPECRPDGKSIGLSRKLCHEIVNDCDPYFWSALEKERIMLNCDGLHVDSTDQNLRQSSGLNTPS